MLRSEAPGGRLVWGRGRGARHGAAWHVVCPDNANAGVDGHREGWKAGGRIPLHLLSGMAPSGLLRQIENLPHEAATSSFVVATN
jgi:hypothetical protein